MSEIVIYFNANCSKCRGTLDILKDRGIEPQIVKYLDEPPTHDALENIIALLPDRPTELVRKDSRFKELGLNANNYISKESVIELLVEHPELMQRPIVIRGNRAVIARPSKKVNEIFV